MKVIDLKENETLIEDYVKLRNKHSKLLLTTHVTISGTKEWLKNEDIEARCVVKDNCLLGGVILYLKKDNEIAFFVKDQNKGIGTKLLSIIEKVAKKKKLKHVWGWVLKNNLIAQKVFIKNEFIAEGICDKEYKGIIKQGIKYKKYLEY